MHKSKSRWGTPRKGTALFEDAATGTMKVALETIQKSGEVADGEMTLHTQVFHSFEELAAIQQEWDEFVESLGGEIFLTYDWCRVWWKYYGVKRELMILLFRDHKSLCGILPLFLEKIAVYPVSVNVVKIVGTDFAPISLSLPIRNQYIDQVVTSFIRRVSRQWRWDILHVGPMCGRYRWVDRWIQAFNENLAGSHRLQMINDDVQTYIPIADNWEQQVKSLRPRQRTKIRQMDRELQGIGISTDSYFASNETFDEMFQGFVEMHQSQWKRVGMPGHFVDWPYAFEFHQEIARIQLRHNRLRLLEIRLDHQCIGYVYMYRMGDTYYWFLSARSENENNLHLTFFWIAFSEKVKKALKENVKWIDGMRGRYEYKLLMGGHMLPIRSLLVYSKRPSALVKIILFRSLIWMLDTLYAKVWRRRIAPRLNLNPKPLWKFWVKSHMLSYRDPLPGWMRVLRAIWGKLKRNR